MPGEVTVYGDDERRLDPPAPPAATRAEVMDELAGAVCPGRAPLHSGAWGLAATGVCLMMLSSSRIGRDVALRHQQGAMAA